MRLWGAFSLKPPWKFSTLAKSSTDHTPESSENVQLHFGSVFSVTQNLNNSLVFEKYIVPLSFLKIHVTRVQCMELQARVFCKHCTCLPFNLFVPLLSVPFRWNPFQGNMSLKATFLIVFFFQEQNPSPGSNIFPQFALLFNLLEKLYIIARVFVLLGLTSSCTLAPWSLWHGKLSLYY